MANGYDKIASRVTGSVPCWKEWPRRLRRIYVSLEDWGSSEAAIEDMVGVWDWESGTPPCLALPAFTTFTVA